MMNHVAPRVAADPLTVICADRVMPVIVIHDDADAAAVGEALLVGGLRTAEVTFRTDCAASAITSMRALPDLVVGAGTVVRPEQVDEAVEAGAQFIVTPGLSAAVVARCVAAARAFLASAARAVVRGCLRVALCAWRSLASHSCVLAVVCVAFRV